MKKNFFSFLKDAQPDVLCLQETKMQEGQAEVLTPGYHQYWCSAERKGYSGTLLLSREAPKKVTYGIGIQPFDREGRVITAEFPQFTLVNVYVPNSGNHLARLDERMRWDDAFRAYLTGINEPVIVCGDMNVAHQEIDLKNPKTNHHHAGFTDEERNQMSKLLDAGFIDSFRWFHPNETGAYSWWSYRFHARENNAGWRIDYFLVSQAFQSHMEHAAILSDVMGSDHCPVSLSLSV